MNNFKIPKDRQQDQKKDKYFIKKSVKRNYYGLLAVNQQIKKKRNLILKQSEMKYLSNFRKRNQKRFYKKCEQR